MNAREIVERGLMMLSENPDALNSESCAKPSELDPGFWTSHTESGSLLAHGLCLVFKHKPPNNEADAERKKLTEWRARLGEIVSEYGTDQTERSSYYVKQVNEMHVYMLDAADFFVQANASTGDAARDLLQQAFHKAINATAIEDSLVPTPDSPTILFLSAHEFYGTLLLMTNDQTRGKAAYEAFDHAAKKQAVQLSTHLGKARAKKLEGCPGDAKVHYQAAKDMLDTKSDGEALPFWEELQDGLSLSGDCVEPKDDNSLTNAALGQKVMLMLLGIVALGLRGNSIGAGF